MSESTERKCPDCQGDLGPIQIIDRSRLTEIISHDAPLAYASPDAKPGFWTRSIAAEGLVRAFACKECGRILLYAEPSR